MTAQHKPPYLRRLSFAADPLWFRPEPLLDPSLFDSDCGAFNALDVDQKEEAFLERFEFLHEISIPQSTAAAILDNY